MLEIRGCASSTSVCSREITGITRLCRSSARSSMRLLTRRTVRNIAPKISIWTNRETAATITNRGMTQLAIETGLHFLGFFALISVAARIYRGGDGLFLLGGNLLAALYKIVRPFAQLTSFALSVFPAFFGALAQIFAGFLAGFGSKENAHKGADSEAYHEVTDFGSAAVAHFANPRVAQRSTPAISMQQSVAKDTSCRGIWFWGGAGELIPVEMLDNAGRNRPRYNAGEIFCAGQPH